MRKPIEPEKMITINGMVEFHDWDYWHDNKVPFEDFTAWCTKNVPTGATDTSLKLNKSWEYDDCIVSLELHWKQMVPNPNYNKDLKKYEKKLVKWKKEQCQK